MRKRKATIVTVALACVALLVLAFSASPIGGTTSAEPVSMQNEEAPGLE